MHIVLRDSQILGEHGADLFIGFPSFFAFERTDTRNLPSLSLATLGVFEPTLT
jgi:hypothetical protein